MRRFQLLGSFLLLFTLLFAFSSVCLATYLSPYAEPTVLVKKGSSGTQVKWVQDMLNHVRLSLRG